MPVRNPREVYGRTLVRLGVSCTNIVVLEADLGKSTMTTYFQAAYPERYFEMGIAEQNMASFAAGLCLAGKIPFINTFAVFSFGRTYDQLRQGICTANLGVRIAGSSAGLSDYGDGATHQAVEDLAIMRALPNMTVLVPADAGELQRMVEATVKIRGPVYIRINRNDMPDITPPDGEFALGAPLMLCDGDDAVVFACGIMAAKALAVAAALRKEGISVRVVNVSTLKPFNDKAVQEFSCGVRAVVTAEEHSIIGGLAAAVAFALRGMTLPIECVAVNDRFGQSAQSYETLLAHYGLTEEDICRAVRSALDGVKRGERDGGRNGGKRV